MGPITTAPLRPGISFSKDRQSPEFTSAVFVQASAWKALAMAGEQVDIDKVRAMHGQHDGIIEKIGKKASQREAKNKQKHIKENIVSGFVVCLVCIKDHRSLIKVLKSGC